MAESGASVYNPAFVNSKDSAEELAPTERRSGFVRAGRARDAAEDSRMKKTELLERVREAHGRLVAALDGLDEAEATRTGLNENWSVKDALSHVVAWEVEGARIISEIQQGTWEPRRVSKEFVDEFNARAVGERRSRTMREVTDEFNTAHQEMERVLGSLPDEVDEKSPAFEYARGVTFRHHAHHARQIEEFRKGMGDRG